jgi:hypothetical protein
MLRKESHGFAWAVTGLAFLAIAGVWRNSVRHEAPPPSRPASADPGAGVDWFFMLRMPPVTAQYESGIDTMKERYASWLDALRRAGYRPMLLSEVRDRLSRGEKLPPKTVVTVFDPGYRHTCDILAPIFKRHAWPAVWLSNGPAMDRAQREFITYHAARQMIGSGWWDVGFSRSDGSFEVRSRDHGAFSLGNATAGAWSPVDGTFAVNHGARMNALNVLTVNTDWGPDDLLSRLNVELPAEGPTYLTKGEVLHRDWGVALPADGARKVDERFSVASPLGHRGARLYWLSTKAEPDFRLHVDAASIIGEFQLHLREDDAAGEELVLTYAASKLVVQELPGKKAKPLFVGRHPAGQGKRFTADILLRGRHLEISYNGGPKWSTDALKNRGAPNALVQVSIMDRVSGIAQADSVALRFTPLPARPSLQ